VRAVVVAIGIADHFDTSENREYNYLSLFKLFLIIHIKVLVIKDVPSNFYNFSIICLS